MLSIPRIITVDPQATVSRSVRAVVELFDQPVIQIDVPGSLEALEEVRRGGCALLVTAHQLDQHMDGIELAQRVRQTAPDTALIVVTDSSNGLLPDEARLICLRRPLDAYQLMRAVHAGLRGQDLVTAAKGAAAPTPAPAPAGDYGPVPSLDLKAASAMIDNLLTDVGALAVVLSSRDGRVLVERGAVSYLNREQLTSTLLPMVHTTITIGDLVGGHASALQFYDGETYDVFVLSVGFHYFLSLIFDGQAGVRQFGAVTRFGRRAAEDLKALLGAAATAIYTSGPTPKPEILTEPEAEPEPAVDTVEPIALRAETWEDTPVQESDEPKREMLPPITDFDPAILDQLAVLDLSAADDLFDPDRLAEIALEVRQGRGPLTYEEARELGIVP